MNQLAQRVAGPIDEHPQLLGSGRAMIPGELCQYADAVKPGDLVAANFDVKRVHSGGALYLLEAVEGERVTWRGCRRMMSAFSGGIAIDQTGHGDWVTVPSVEANGYRIAGIVEKVYRPTDAR